VPEKLLAYRYAGISCELLGNPESRHFCAARGLTDAPCWGYEVTDTAMKLRLQGNSLRLRLTRAEVARLDDHGTVEEAVSFKSGGSLTYRIQSDTGAEQLHADFSGGAITVLIPTQTVRTWAAGDEVGLYAQDVALRIAVEKDFRCLTRPEEEPDAYPHPAQ
jgi:hypothetical protein